MRRTSRSPMEAQKAHCPIRFSRDPGLSPVDTRIVPQGHSLIGEPWAAYHHGSMALMPFGQRKNLLERFIEVRGQSQISGPTGSESPGERYELEIGERNKARFLNTRRLARSM